MRIKIYCFGQYLIFIGIDYQELKQELLGGFRLSNPNYSPPEISHMIQTCWLPDPNERPTFTTLKQITWESLSTCNRDGCNASQFSFTSSTNDEMHTRYKTIRNCNHVYQRHKNLGNKDEYIQRYADLELPMAIEFPNMRPTADQFMAEYSGESEEKISMKELKVRNKRSIHNNSNGSSKRVRIYISTQPHEQNIMDKMYL